MRIAISGIWWDVGGDMSKTKNGVPWKELRQKEVIKESRYTFLRKL